MALGQEIAPHLPMLRRFARALTGNQSKGDVFLRHALEAIVQNPEAFPRDIDTRLALYQMYLRSVDSAAPAEDIISGDHDGHISGDSDQTYNSARRALLLTAMEGFTPDDTAFLLGESSEEVERLVKEGLDQFRVNNAKVLIVEDEPVIAMDLDSIVRDLGHEVVGVVADEEEAISQALRSDPDLILMDIQLRGDGSGISAAMEIVRTRHVPFIFITAYPERLLSVDRPEPTFLITKPFQRSTVKAAISQALFFDQAKDRRPFSHDAPEAEVPDSPESAEQLDDVQSASANDAVDELANNDLTPQAAPIITKLIGPTLSRASQWPISTPIPLQPLERLRLDHLATADRLCASTQTDNLGMAFNTRLSSLRNALSEPIDEASGLTLGVQAQGLRRMLPAVHEQMSPATAADIEIFINDVFQIAAQFPDYQQFTDDAIRNGLHTQEQKVALARVSEFFEKQPDNLVAPDIKADLAAVRINAEDRSDEVADLAFERVIGNVLRTYGDFLRSRLRGVNNAMWQSFDKASGGTIGVIIAMLLIGLPVFLLLQAAFPGSYPFLLSMMKLVKLIIP